MRGSVDTMVFPLAFYNRRWSHYDLYRLDEPWVTFIRIPPQPIQGMLPDAFGVTAEGAAMHGVTQTFVKEHGLPLGLTLKEFVASAQEAFTRDARLAARQIDFGAGVSAAGLQRCGLHQESEFWDEAVPGGICTMDPLLGNWIRKLIGDVGEQGRSRKQPLGLKDYVRPMVPKSAELRRQNHTADKDAEMA